MDYPKFIVSNLKEESISILRVKEQLYTYFPKSGGLAGIDLILILLIYFVQKMSSAYYICCIYSNALQTYFITEANTMNADKTAPILLGAV